MLRPRSDQDDSAIMMRTLIVLIALGFGGIVLYALQASQLYEFFAVTGVGILIAGAALLGGGLVGFLFGIPRTASQEPAAPSGGQAENVGAQSPGTAYRANTNLEQISDWLTKILVGVGLTQIGEIPHTLQRGAEYAASGLGDFASSRITAVGIILYFSVCGFLLGYLWTRLYLAGALRKADLSLQQLLPDYIATLDSIEPKLDEANRLQVRALRQQAEQHLVSLTPNIKKADQQFAALAREYERLRQTLPAGSERTLKMSANSAQVKALAVQVDYNADDIRRLFETGNDGNRIVALVLLRVKRHPQCFDIALTAIDKSRSAFEQYQALRTMEELLPALTADQRQQLKNVLNDQRSGGPGKYIIPDSDRWPLSERMLATLQA